MKPKNFPFEFLYRKYETFFDTRIIENNFEDFDVNHISIQIKVIYEDLRNALEKKEIPFLLRSLHKEVFMVFFFIFLFFSFLKRLTKKIFFYLRLI